MKNTCKNFKSKMFWYAVIFLSPREGKFKQKNNQLFSWLKKEGKTEASAWSDGWPVGPVSANPYLYAFFSVITFIDISSINLGWWLQPW